MGKKKPYPFTAEGRPLGERELAEAQERRLTKTKGFPYPRKPELAERKMQRAALGRSGVALKQRTVDKAVKAVGGRGSKAVQEVKDAEDFRSRSMRNLRPKTAKMSAKLQNKALSTAEDVIENKGFGRKIPLDVARRAGRSVHTIARGVAKGMLSPAGLAEDFAGRAAADAAREQFLKKARQQGKKSKSGLKKPTMVAQQSFAFDERSPKKA